MKFLKVAFAAAFAFGFGNAYAFHSGGVAECDGCHTMHNSDGGVAMTAIRPQFQAGPYLLQGNTQSEACLNCHQHEGDTGPSGYHISTAIADMQTAGDSLNTMAVPRQMTPGGDFGWIRADVPFAVRGTPSTNFGAERGHNVVAPFYGYVAQAGTAPGGTFVAANLQCSSCHDPHGKYRVLDSTQANIQSNTGAPIAQSGSYGAANKVGGYANGVYRLLGGSGYAPKSYNAGAFTSISPVAVVPSTYNRSEATTETVATYGTGMSEFCANCHPNMLMNSYTSGMAGLRHPAGSGALLPAAIAANYVAYVKSGNLTGVAPNYNSLVPFETGSANASGVLVTTTSNSQPRGYGPTAGTTSNVMCLSCHRAHASGFRAMIRFSHDNEFMTIADATGLPIYDTGTVEGKINQGFAAQVAQETQYYGRAANVFSGYQRLLCNKCHAKD